MMARILKGLLLLQLLAVIALASWYAQFQPMRALSWPCLLVLAASSVLLLRALIMAFPFVLNRYFGVAPAQPLTWRCFCHMLAQEFAATMMASSWRMAWPRKYQYIDAEAHGLPVLLIHGYACNGAYWEELSAVLRQARISHAALDLEPLGAGIDAYAAQVQKALETLCLATGSSAAIIVTHSMGGLVARAWLRAQRLGRAPGSANSQVVRLIMLGAPHFGTSLARLCPGRNAGQMRHASTWLTTLAASESMQQRGLMTSIFSRHDNIIRPYTSSYLPSAKNIAFDGVGHVALGRDPALLACVMREILATSVIVQ